MPDRITDAQLAMLTKEQAIIITGFTGVMLCDYEDFIADINRRLAPAEPITPATLFNLSFEQTIKPLYAPDAQAIMPVDWQKEATRATEAQLAERAALEAEANKSRIILAS